MRVLAACCAASFAVAAVDAGANCGSAFCLVNTDWSAQGAWVEPGARADLRYEFVDLNHLQSGNRRVAIGEIPREHDTVETRNRNWFATFDWSAGAWGASLSIPFVDRYHLRIENDGDEKVPETWAFRELGDLRLIARREL